MKKIISMLLVLAMVITVLTVGMTATSAAETATITIYGLDGTTEVKEVNVGDEFTVYSTLNVSASATDGRVGSVQGTQTYSSDVLSLVDEVSGQYGEFVDPVKVFPVTGETTMANGAQAGRIVYNASTPSTANGFKFDSDSSLLIVTTYKVTAAGTAEVKNALKNLAAADDDLTKIVFEGEVQSGKTVAGKASFEDPTPTIDHAEVRIHSLNGSVETKSFNVGDTFTAYTFLDASSVNDGKMASVNGIQRYTSAVLELADAVDGEGLIENTATVFPIMKEATIANAKNAGIIKYSASSTEGFLFNSAQSQLIATTYKVTANGYADITNKLNVLGAADDDITRIVFNGELQDGMSYSMTGSFDADNPVPTEPVYDKLKVTIVNPDNTTEVKEFSVGATFTVYTVLNAGTTIASVDGTQTYPTASLRLTDAVEGEYNEIVNKTAMFPILGSEAVAAVNNGEIKFNASRAAVGGGYAFNTAESKLIVTNYKVLKTGTATVKTTLKTLIKDDADTTKIVFNGATQSGQSYSMPGSFNDPSNPVQPTDPPQPTQPPTTPSDKAVVTIYGVDGSSKAKTFNIGDTFTVYTTLDASKFGLHGIGSISATQTFTESVLQSTDEVDDLSVVADPATMFPILGENTVAKIADGQNKYNASTPGINKGYVFDNANALLLVTNYKVIAAGEAEVRNTITTMAGDDSNLTKIVSKGVVQEGYELAGIASFHDPSLPEPTEPPTGPPTQPIEEKATVTIYGIDGASETKIFDVGNTFTVYTTFDASKASATGIASLSASQTFTSSVLKNTDEVDELGVIVDNNAMFPVFGDKAVAKVSDGLIKYNASNPTVNKGFVFNGNDTILILSHYTVTAGGTAEIRNSLTTVAAADQNLTRLVEDGVVKDGVVFDGIASFVDPTGPVVPTQPVERYMLGDADNSGDLETPDATVIQRKLARMSVPFVDEAIMLRNGDVDGDGELTTADITLIQRKLARMATSYPVGEYVEVK